MTHKPSFPIMLSGMEPEDLRAFLDDEPRYRADQVFGWIHRGVETFEAMTNLPAGLRDRLAGSCRLRSTTPAEILTGEDGTRKYRIELGDGLSIEAVVLTDEQGRHTACLSTQVGCAMGCAFCRTGAMGFKRNLAASEIVEQYHHLVKDSGRIANIVFMGMGEPLMNTDNLCKAVRILTHPDGPAISPRRITVSTCGIAPDIHTLAEKAPGLRLALSLPAANPEKRRTLMPGASRYSLEELKAALVRHQSVSGDRITIETVLFGGVNTSRQDAEELTAFTTGLKTVINVIPFNPFEGGSFSEPREDEVHAYVAALKRGGLKVTRRYRRGRGILGACGQLAT